MPKFNWKKKTAIFIGRFQPFHDGHKKIVVNTDRETIKESANKIIKKIFK